MRIVEGTVTVTENTNFYDHSYSYGDVTNERENLNEVLWNEFEGKKVRVTIEVIKEEGK
jgi:hypothetical protein